MTRGHDRGVSEAIGFVLIFAVITATIGMVYATGFVGLYNAQQAEQHTNMERAFDVLESNIDSVQSKAVPSRATEIKLAGGTLEVDETVAVTVVTDSTEVGSCNVTRQRSFSTRPIVYEDGDTRVMYAAGGVIRGDGSEGVMLSGPPMVVGEERSVLPITTVRTGEGERSLGGHVTVQVLTVHQSQSVSCHLTGDGTGPMEVNVTLEATPAIASAWEAHFLTEGYDVERPNEETVYVTFETDELVVTRTTIEAGILR